MWRVILLVFCYHVVSQPVNDEPATRITRELIECCPCPGSKHGGDKFRASLDDCPCRHSADSEGASSMFFPTRAAAGSSANSVPFMRSNDPNDIKNLLEPEVGLATSVLQTLREATEEEYRDALARDAARSSDAVPEESARSVVIIVKPRVSDNEDGLVSEASNTKETRCINPVGSSLGRTGSKPLRTLPDLFRLPKARQPSLHRNLWDMDSNVGASNVQHSVVDKNGGAAEFKPRSPLFKLRTPLKEHPFKNSINSYSLKSPTDINKLEQTLKKRPNIFDRLNLPLIPKMKVDKPFRKANNHNQKSDLSPAPSNIHELINKEDDNGLFKFNKRPLMLKNLLKLKDVELIPRTIPKTQIFRSKSNTKGLVLPTSPNTADADNNCDDSTYDSVVNEKSLTPKKVTPTAIENIEVRNVPNVDSSLQNMVNGVVESEEDKDNQDTITSPSEIIPNVLENTQSNTLELDDIDCNDVPSEEIIPSTEETITKFVDDNRSAETLDPVVESEIFEDKTENIKDETEKIEDETVKFEDKIQNNDDGNASKGCATDEVSESGNEISEQDTDGSNNIGNFIPFNLQDSEDSRSHPQLEKPEQDTITTTGNGNEDFNSVRSAEDQTQRIETKPEIINKNIIPIIKPIPGLSETLSTIKDNVRKSLDNLKKTTQNVIPKLSPVNNKSENLKTDIPETLDQEQQKDALIGKTDDCNTNVNDNVEDVTFNDLQKLSDDLLDLSSNKEENTIPKEAEAEDGSSEPNFKSNQEQTTEEILSDFPGSEANTTDLRITMDTKVDPVKGKACHVSFDENKTKQKTVQIKSAIRDNDSKDMTVDASAPIANTLPALLDPLNLNEQLGSSLLQNINPLDPLNLNEELGSPLLPNLDPFNLNSKLRSPVFSGISPLNLNEERASPILPNLDPLNLNLGSSLIDPLNLNEKLESLLQPNLDPLNVRSTIQDIVQPSISEDPLNILGKPIGDVFKLPTLEDLRQRLSSVFDTNDRSAENNFSDEEGDCTNDAPVEMAHAASTNDFRKVPSMRTLEDMNVDIFQLNPQSKPDVFSNAPRLNLNNFRAKLPIPSNLDLKPVKLESRVGNNKGNVLGASLTFGNDKPTLRKAKPNSNVPSVSHPLGSLPSLDELRDTFLSNTQSLLGTQLHPNLDLFRDSSLRAPSVIPDIDEIRRNAEKTMKGLQQRMKSTFKGKIHNPLSEKFARPQDLLEDVNDKLRAIHYDLNDRLSSIHEDILDQTRLKPLAIPARPTFSTGRNTNKNIVNNIRKTKGKPARFQASASTIASHEIDPFGKTNDRTLLRSPARSSLGTIKSNSHSSLLGSESSPVATKLAFPKTKTTVDSPRKTTLPPLPRLPSLRQGSETLFPQNIRGKPLIPPRQPGLVKDLKRPLLGKPNPFKDKNSKVTITFATTTPSPVTSPTQFKKTPSVKPDNTSNHIKPKGESLKERLAISRSKTLGDAKQSASEFTASSISTPINSKTNFKTANSGKDHAQLQSLEPIENRKSKLPNLKGFKDSKLRLNENNPRKLDSSWSFDNNKPEVRNVEVVTEKSKVSPLVWPKSGEESFLAKVREAMQARLKSFNPTKISERVEIPKVESSNADMIRSASENNDVIVDEHLKENVPYKCRMLCTRG